MSRSRRTTARLAAVALAPLLAPAPALADGLLPLVDIEAQVGRWEAAPSGTVSSDGDDFDVEDDLGFDRNGANLVMAGIEHPVPLLPNVRLRHMALSDTATSTGASGQFDGLPITAGDDVRSSYDIEMTDATFYYSPLNNWVSLDLGLTARYLDAEAELEDRDSGASRRAGGSVVVPMAHLAGRIDVPATGIYAAAEANAVSADDEHIRDVRAAIGWEATPVLGIEAGYQELSVDVDDVDDLSTDLEFEGPYASVTMRF